MKDFEFSAESNSGTLLGGVRLPRELTDLSIWRKTPFDPAHALCDLYMLANNTSGTFKNARGIVINYEAGESLFTVKALAERWAWKRESVEKFLVELEKSEIIRRRPIAQYGQVIKLVEFDTNPDSQPSLNLNTLGHPEGHGKEHRAGHPEGHGKGSGVDTVGDGSLGEEKELGGGGPAAAPVATLIPTLREVLELVETDDIPEAYLRVKFAQAVERADFDKPGWKNGWRSKLIRFWEDDQEEWTALQKKSAPNSASTPVVSLADMRTPA